MERFLSPLVFIAFFLSVQGKAQATQTKGSRGHSQIQKSDSGRFRSSGTEQPKRWYRTLSIQRSDLKDSTFVYWQDGTRYTRRTDIRRGPYCAFYPQLKEPTRSGRSIFREGVNYQLEMPGRREPDPHVDGAERICFLLRNSEGRTVGEIEINGLSPESGSLELHNQISQARSGTLRILEKCMGKDITTAFVTYEDWKHFSDFASVKLLEAIEKAESEYLRDKSPQKRRSSFVHRNTTFAPYWEGEFLELGVFPSKAFKEGLRNAIYQLSVEKRDPEIYREYWENQYSRVSMISDFE